MNTDNIREMNDAAVSKMDGVLRRIQKLLAMANDGRGDVNEAAAAAEMAEKLMRKFQIDNSDVIAAELRAKPGSSLSKRSVFANMKRDDAKRPPLMKNPPWGQHLAVAIARLNDCEVRQGWEADKHGKVCACLTFFGYAGDVEVCAFLFDYIVGALISACQWFNKQRKDEGRADKVSSDSYRRGFTASITARIYDQKYAKDMEQKMSASTALVLCKQQAIQEHFGDFGYKNTARKAVGDTGAFGAGSRDGRSVDLNRRGLGGGTASTSASVGTARRLT